MTNSNTNKNRKLHQANRKFLSTSLSIIAFLALSAAFAAGQAGTGQTPTTSAPAGASPTASGIKHLKHQSGPIVVNWKIKLGKGKDKIVHGVDYEPVTKPADVNLTVNEDGSWNFSGNFPENKGHDLDVVVGLKAKDGSIVLFHFCGSLDDGQQFNKTGTSETIKDSFKSFTPADWYANYRQPLNSEGVAKQYEEREEKKSKSEAARKKEEAKEKKEIKAEVARQMANRERKQQQEEQQSQQNSSNGGGGGGGTTFSSVMGDVTSALGTVSSIGSDIGDIAGLF